MNKSVYSIVLMDSVINEIDKLAYRMNTNRSNMINQILAEYVSMSTPQEINRNIFNILERHVNKNDIFKIQPQTSTAMMVIKSALNYKYNPIIKYSVELTDNYNGDIGCIKISIRTQNENLLEIIKQYFNLYKAIEEKYIDFKGYSFHSISNGKLIRKFIVPSDSGYTEQQIGEAIALYIEYFDKAIKMFLSNENSEDIVNITNRLYKEYLKKQKVII